MFTHFLSTFIDFIILFSGVTAQPYPSNRARGVDGGMLKQPYHLLRSVVRRTVGSGNEPSVPRSRLQSLGALGSCHLPREARKGLWVLRWLPGQSQKRQSCPEHQTPLHPSGSRGREAPRV